MNFSKQKSLRGYHWHIREYDEKLAQELHRRKNISPILSQLLVLKNIAIDDVDNYLNPKIKNLLRDPYDLLDMEAAVNTIENAIVDKKRLCIFGDYDVDGATATALMVRFFRALGIDVLTYIPDRIDDGYGMNEDIVKKLHEQGVEFIITVDCGISCHAAVEMANELGMTVVITDHHRGSEELPRAAAVVNPNRLDEKTPYGYLAGVGVAFMFCIALNSRLRKNGYYEKHHIEEVNLLSLLDLVALGTICDVMPLVGINRAFVCQGLKIFKNKNNNLGLATLAEVLGLGKIDDVYHLGFVIGPRINAGGRVGNASLGSKLLVCEDKLEARKLAEQLDNFNRERQTLEKDILDQAIEQIEREKLQDEPVIFVKGKNWHEGVIGVIASRLKDRYNRPVFVISHGEDGMAKASCRSVDRSIDIGSHIIEARERGLLVSGGGHTMAGGLTFSLDNLESLKQFMVEKIEKHLNSYLKHEERYADLLLDMNSINEKLLDDFEATGPFGVENSEPLVIIPNILVLNTKRFGRDNEHLRCIITSSGLDGQNETMVANIFRFADKNISDDMFRRELKRCTMVGSLSLNSWMNVTRIQLRVEDVIGEE